MQPVRSGRSEPLSRGGILKAMAFPAHAEKESILPLQELFFKKSTESLKEGDRVKGFTPEWFSTAP